MTLRASDLTMLQELLDEHDLSDDRREMLTSMQESLDRYPQLTEKQRKVVQDIHDQLHPKYRVPVQGEGPWWLPENRHGEDGRRVKRPGTITWTEHVEVWEAYAKKYSGQSAERIAERGGFGYWEAFDLIGHELKTWEPTKPPGRR